MGCAARCPATQIACGRKKARAGGVVVTGPPVGRALRLGELLLQLAGAALVVEKIHHVVDDGLVAGLHLVGGDIPALLETGWQHQTAEKVFPFGRHLDIGSGIEDEIRLAEFPVIGGCRRGSDGTAGVFFPLGTSAIDPAGQRLDVGIFHFAAIAQRHACTREPRGHAAGSGEIADILGPAECRIERGERERGEAPRLVANLAVGAQQRGNRPVVGGCARSSGFGRHWPGQGTAVGAGGRESHRAAGQQVFHGQREVLAIDPAAGFQPGGIAVVDAAAVQRLALGVEKERLGRDTAIERLLQFARGIEPQGNGDRQLHASSFEQAERLLLFRLAGGKRVGGQNADQRDAQRLEPGGKTAELGEIAAGHGAIEREEDRHHPLGARQIGEREGPPGTTHLHQRDMARNRGGRQGRGRRVVGCVLRQAQQQTRGRQGHHRIRPPDQA